MTNNIPRRYQDVDFDFLPDILKEKYPLLTKRTGLYVFGGVGTGKTYAAYAMYKKWEEERQNQIDAIDKKMKEVKDESGKRLDDQGNEYYYRDSEYEERKRKVLEESDKVKPNMLFWNVPKLIFTIKSEFGKDNYGELITERLLNTHKVFILDDIGVEKPTEFVEEVLYLLINAQYEKEYPMLITSNLKLSELGDRLGLRIASRIKEMCELIELTGKDKRISKK